MTAAVSQAEKTRLAELLNLQSHFVDHMDEGQTNSEVDRQSGYGQYNTMKWSTINPDTLDTDGEMHCPTNYKRIGCCKCVLDDHVPEHHIVGTEHHDLSPSIHGSNLEANANYEYDYRGTMYGYYNPEDQS